jgi:hypothetical protein
MWYICREYTEFANSFRKRKKSNLWLIAHGYRILNITLDHMWQIGTEYKEFANSFRKSKKIKPVVDHTWIKNPECHLISYVAYRHGVQGVWKFCQKKQKIKPVVDCTWI